MPIWRDLRLSMLVLALAAASCMSRQPPPGVSEGAVSAPYPEDEEPDAAADEAPTPGN